MRTRKLIARLDSLQQSHPWLAFTYAVIRKYNDDNGGNHGVLITYYVFLALFPLLFAVTATLQLLFRHDAHAQTVILSHIDNIFPLIGSQLRSNIKSVGRTGTALVIAIGIAVYGAHNAADAFRHTLDAFWGIPKKQNAGFPRSTVKSFVMVITGGGVLLLTAALASYATTLGHAATFKILTTLLSFALLVGILFFIQYVGLSKSVGLRPLWFGALLAAIGLQVLQTYGGYLMTHELHSLNTPYGAFSVTLGLLFWLYLQVEVLLYTLEISVVQSRRLWPRSLSTD